MIEENVQKKKFMSKSLFFCVKVWSSGGSLKFQCNNFITYTKRVFEKYLALIAYIFFPHNLNYNWCAKTNWEALWGKSFRTSTKKSNILFPWICWSDLSSGVSIINSYQFSIFQMCLYFQLQPYFGSAPVVVLRMKP